MAIEVIITDTTRSDRTPVSTPTAPQGSEDTQGVSQTRAERSADKGVAAAGLVAVQHVMPYVNTAINFGVSQIQMQTGSAELQRKAQVVTSAVSFAANVTMSAVVGGIPGAAVSIALQTVQSMINMTQRSIEIQNQKTLENENISYKRSRMGMTVNRSRTGGVS